MNLRYRKQWTATLAWGLIAGMSVLPVRAWLVETPVEFITRGDFDGDGRLDAVVLDKATGTLRVAFQNAATELLWQPAFASGIGNATSLAVGRISSNSWDSLAVTGPEANRINKLEPRLLLTTTGLAPTSLFPPGVGPSLLVAMDIGGAGNNPLDDYFLLTTENPGVRHALLRNTGTATSVLDEGGLSRALTSANRFEIKSGQGRRLGGLLRSGRFFLTEIFQVLDLSAGTQFSPLAFTTAGGVEFVAHRFASNNPLGQVLFYEPGRSDLTRYQFQESAADLSLGGSNRFRLDAGLQRVQPLPLANGARLLALFGSNPTNITKATIYAFDGTNQPQSVQSFTGSYSGALVLGNANLALLKTDAAGRSIGHQVLLANGNTYTLGSTGDLPALNRFSGSANALLFDVEPFLNSAARPRQLQRHADWSTALRVSPTVRVTGQQFLGTSNGLGAATSRDFGAPVSGVTAGLVNQYLPNISLFSGRDALGTVEGDLRVSPPGGHYGEAQRLTLSLNAPGNWQIFYRATSAQNWAPYTVPFLVIAEATVEYYAKRTADGVLTPIGRSTYTFSEAAGELDSDHDGVPDFVELTRGLDPLGGPDSDGDGFTDLEELARGTNPLSANSKPASNAALRNAFNRLVTPRPPHPASGTAIRAYPNVPLRAFNLGGSFLGLANTSIAYGTGITNPAALFRALLPEPGARLIVETTPDHYDIVTAPDSRVGRELIGLVPVPATNNFEVPYVLGNGSLATETANWIVAASNAVAAAVNPTVAGLLTPESSLIAALFERNAVNGLLARGTNAATNATLFPFRAGDASRRRITSPELLGLEQYVSPVAPGYRVDTVFRYLDGYVRTNASVTTLNAFIRELWRISAAQNNANEGLYPLPFDELRRLLAGQSLTASYLAFASIGTNVTTARNQALNTVASIPSRPRTNLTVVVAANDPGGEPIRVQTQKGTPITLWRFNGVPFAFPPNLQLLPGTEVSLFAHSDLPAPPGTLALEVIALNLSAVPMPSPSDADGNLLVDSWEEVFFGRRGVDPFADADGDGYSNLEEMLAGTQPDDGLFAPGGPPHNLSPPVVTLDSQGAQLKFTFNWPAALIDRFEFGLQASEQVGGPYVSTPAPPLIPVGGDRFEIQAPVGDIPAQFYRLTLRFAE